MGLGWGWGWEVEGVVQDAVQDEVVGGAPDCSVSLLYADSSLLEISATTIMSSANLMMVFVTWTGWQSSGKYLSV